MKTAFVKYHGLGNDFIVVDLRAAADDLRAAVQTPAFVTAVCDRQFGVGGDGVLAILPPTSSGSVARMRVLNSDGSEAEMCGNGIRCVARYLREEAGVTANPMAIDTGAGLLTCDVTTVADGAVMVSVDMGRPRWLRGEVPVAGPSADVADNLVVDVAGLPPSTTFAAVSMGNPHAIAFVASRAQAMELAQRVGPAIETHPMFPARTNVEFAHVRGAQALDLVVWERGCGITLACGTGACATAVAACRAGLTAPGLPIAVHLPGGTLQILVEADYSRVTMTGPAQRVARGTLEVADILASRRPG
ncbi:MAG: diaminopimelate epimerase [Myxococcales bacterium]|nr:diaminopimelate epimerase [Myxococcales bacterium]